MFLVRKEETLTQWTAWFQGRLGAILEKQCVLAGDR